MRGDLGGIEEEERISYWQRTKEGKLISNGKEQEVISCSWLAFAISDEP